jgi:hypothetical protein
MLHLILTLPVDLGNLPPYEWVTQHIQVVGWPALCIIAWKAGNVFHKFVDRLEKTTNQIDMMATNHTPHIQDGILELVDLGKANNEKLDKLMDVLKG